MNRDIGKSNERPFHSRRCTDGTQYNLNSQCGVSGLYSDKGKDNTGNILKGVEGNKFHRRAGDNPFGKQLLETKESVDSLLILNEGELVHHLKSKIVTALAGMSIANNDQIMENLVSDTVKKFKKTMKEKLLSMGVNRYKKNIAGAGGFIKRICTDYFKNTEKILGFNLVAKRDKNTQSSKRISVEANDFIESVNLDNVVARVNNTRDKESIESEKIDLSEYLEVVEMDAGLVLVKLAQLGSSLGFATRSWLASVKNIIGDCESEESFRNYLQRAMSMKYEIDENLNHPEKENIENSLREIVPMLYNDILLAKSKGEKRSVNGFSKIGNKQSVSEIEEKLNDNMTLDSVLSSINKDRKSKNKEIIDLSEYLEVVEMDASIAMGKLESQRTSLTPDVSRWFGAVQRIAGPPGSNESFRNYLQRAMSVKYEIDKNLNHPGRENIENSLREIVPMLYNDILLAKSKGEKRGVNGFSKIGSNSPLVK